MSIQLSPQQKKNIERLAKVLDGGYVAILQYINELEAKIEEIKQSNPNISDVLTQIKGKDASPQDVAQTLLNNSKFIAAVTGEKGETYTLSPQDVQDIAKVAAQKIKVPIVEKVIEIQKTEVIKEQPIVTEITKETINQVPNDLSPEEARNLLELLQGDERLDAKAIKGLPELEKKVSSFGPAVGPSGVKFYVDDTKKGLLREVNLKSGSGVTLSHSVVNGLPTVTFSANGNALSFETPSGTVDGSNTTFTVTHAPKYIFVDRMPKFSEFSDYSYAGGTITILDGAPPTQNIISLY